MLVNLECDMSELKSCPFCGGEAEIECYGTSKYSTRYACTNCGLRLETGEEFNHGERWNQRQDDWVSVNNDLPKESGAYWTFNGNDENLA